MPEDPQNFTHEWMRRIERKLDKVDHKIDAVMEELYEIRSEASTDRARMSGVDGALVTIQRRQLKTDQRVDDLTAEVASLRQAVER